MFDEKIKGFYSKVSEDQTFKEKLLKIKEKYKDLNNAKEKFYKISNELLLPHAKSLGFNFTVEDLLDYEKQVISQKGMELGESDLESISGGLSATFSSICLTALMGLSSLSGLATASTSPLTTDKDEASSNAKPKSSYSYTIDKDSALSIRTPNSDVKIKFNFDKIIKKIKTIISEKLKIDNESLTQHGAKHKHSETESDSKNVVKRVNTENQSENKQQESSALLGQVKESVNLNPITQQSEKETKQDTSTLPSQANEGVSLKPTVDIEGPAVTPAPPSLTSSVESETKLNTQTVTNTEENKNSETKPSDRASLLVQIQQGNQLKHVDTTPSSPTLLDQIRTGIKLKPVDKQKPHSNQKEEKVQSGDSYDALLKSLKNKVPIFELEDNPEQGNNTENASEWDD